MELLMASHSLQSSGASSRLWICTTLHFWVSSRCVRWGAQHGFYSTQ